MNWNDAIQLMQKGKTMTTPTQSEIKAAIEYCEDIFPRHSNEYLETIRTILQSALDTQKPAGDALTGDCGGGDNNVELLKRIRHFLQQVFENRVAKQLTVQVHHHRADTIGSLAEDLRDQINKALTADNAKRGE